MCRKVDHPPCAAGLTETQLLKAKGDKLLVMAGITANPQKAMLQADPVDVLPLPKALAVIPTPGRGDFRGQPLNEPRHRGRMLGELTRPETNALPRPNLFDTLCA